MGRLPRLKCSSHDTWYHLYARLAGRKGEYPLADPLPRRQLIELIHHYASIYFCEVAAFCVMGNHYHLVLRFDAERDVDRKELRARAYTMYRGKLMRAIVDAWGKGEWERYRRRLFDVSEFMRNVQGMYARWYNRTYERQGRLWGDRFKSVLLGDERAVLDCVLYVELNPVRAGLVERPETFDGSSVFLREAGEDGWLVPIERLMHRQGRSSAMVEFRQLLYHRGAVPTREGQARIPQKVLEQETARGFQARGAYRKRVAYWVNGVVVGTEGFIRQQLAALREGGIYRRRRHPIPQLDGVHWSLRAGRGKRFPS